MMDRLQELNNLCWDVVDRQSKEWRREIEHRINKLDIILHIYNPTQDLIDKDEVLKIVNEVLG